MKDSKENYGSISKTLHWLVALTIISLLAVGFIMINLDSSDLKWQIYGLHKAFGISLILFAFARIAWRIYQKSLNLPQNYPKWQKVAAHSTHGILYLLTIIMPFSGWVMSMAANHVPSWFGLFELRLPIAESKPLAKIAAQTHEILAWVIIALLVVHVFAALHDKQILARMLPKCCKNK